EHLRGNERMFGKSRTAMHNTMANCNDVVQVAVLFAPLQNLFGSILRVQTLDRSGRDFRQRTARIEQREFHAGRTAVYGQHEFRHESVLRFCRMLSYALPGLRYSTSARS